MKVGLYGGMANNMYVFAKALVRQKVNVCFIRDFSDRFIFSQPVWEDLNLTIVYEKVAQTSSWTWEYWYNWESSLGWQAPNWLIDIKDKSESNEQRFSSLKLLLDRLIANYIVKKHLYWQNCIDMMQKCDVLLVCGIEGSILALLSGKPFVILPHGGDIRTALGLHPPKTKNIRIWVNYLLRLRFLRLAYQKALCIGTHDPLGIVGHIGNTIPKFIESKLKLLPIPLSITPRFSQDKRRDILGQLMTELNLSTPDAKYIGFIPSRVDFYWKGQDRLLQALTKIEHQKQIHLIFSGWGQNYQDIQNIVKQAQLQSHVTFLPCAVSKPTLYKFFQAADFIVDQFLMGTYGTAAIEAMSCGCPILMWIDELAFQKRGWEAPPVINVKTEADIFEAITAITSGQIDLEKSGLLAQEWIQKIHGEEIVVSQFLDYVTPNSSQL